MRKWSIPLAVAAVALLGLASRAAWAGDGGSVHARLARLLHHGPEHPADVVAAHLEAVATRLELRPDQREQVAGLLVQALPGLEARALEAASAHADQLERVHSRELDEAAILAASARAGAAQGELAVAVAKLLREAHAVLTPDQLDRVTELHSMDCLERAAEHVRGIKLGVEQWSGRQ